MRNLVLSVMLWAGLACGAMAEGRTITVTGTAEVAAVPDMAVMSVGVGAQAASAQGALAEAGAATTAILATLADLDVAPRDVQTSTWQLNPVYDQNRQTGERTQRGYAARSDVQVRVRDLAALGPLLDAVVADGANTFGGLRLTLSDPAAMEAEARAAAVRDAAGKAQQIAQAAGTNLGAVQTITEQDFGPRPMGMEMARMSAAADVPVAAGEVTVRVSVTATYAID